MLIWIVPGLTKMLKGLKDDRLAIYISLLRVMRHVILSMVNSNEHSNKGVIYTSSDDYLSLRFPHLLSNIIFLIHCSPILFW